MTATGNIIIQSTVYQLPRICESTIVYYTKVDTVCETNDTTGCETVPTGLLTVVWIINLDRRDINRMSGLGLGLEFLLYE